MQGLHRDLRRLCTSGTKSIKSIASIGGVGSNANHTTTNRITNRTTNRITNSTTNRTIGISHIITALLSAVLVFSLLGLTGCPLDFTNDPNDPVINNPDPNQNSPQNPGTPLDDAPYDAYTAHDGTWAIYWYICGSDIELRDELQYSATGQIQEMMSVTLPDNVTVVIQAGGAKKWHLDIINPGLTNRLVYRGNTLALTDTQPLSNMGDPQTLADFLAYCNLNYPAEHQALIIYDHGGGSLLGIAFDDLYDMDSLTLPELSQVIASRPAASGTYELVGLCACLMSTIDSVAVFNGYTRYLVASEEVELGCTWDYGKIVSAVATNPNINGAALGKVIADGYYAQCEQVGYTCYTTTSVIDMAYADELLAAYNAVGNELLQGAVAYGSEYIAAFGRAAYSSENYGALNNPTSNYDVVDLGDLVLHAQELLPNSSGAMLQTIKNTMAYHLVNPLRADGQGIACYFPYTGSPRSFDLFATLDTSLSFKYFYEYLYTGLLSEEAQEYLTSLSSSSTSEPTPKPLPEPVDLGLDDRGISAHANGTYWLELEERAASVAAVYLWVGLYDQTTKDFVLFGTRNDIYTDWEYGLFYDVFSTNWGSLDGALCYMEAIGEEAGAILYRVPVYHNGAQKDLMVLYSWTEPYYYEGSYQILGLVTLNNLDSNAPDPTFEILKVGDIIEPILYRYSATSGYTTIIGGPGEPMTHTVTITENTRFYDQDMGPGGYMIRFQIIDYTGAVHFSKPGYYIVYPDGIIEFGYVQ